MPCQLHGKSGQEASAKCTAKVLPQIISRTSTKPHLVSFPKLFLSNLYGTSQCYISSNWNSVEAGDAVSCETASTTSCQIVVPFVSLLKKLLFRNKRAAAKTEEFHTD